MTAPALDIVRLHRVGGLIERPIGDPIDMPRARRAGVPWAGLAVIAVVAVAVWVVMVGRL